ncbi:hypothetical protein F2Q68_00029585 [Brassica cretica]|uniref:Uncharacterized protein n=1 Tax=Brassica cretica TaxID=69181 RepID=A0A8S9GJB5_BRACR|nr:hypothetical protein F2Q68_00029585 [Brassica cretica]
MLNNNVSVQSGTGYKPPSHARSEWLRAVIRPLPREEGERCSVKPASHLFRNLLSQAFAQQTRFTFGLDWASKNLLQQIRPVGRANVPPSQCPHIGQKPLLLSSDISLPTRPWHFAYAAAISPQLHESVETDGDDQSEQDDLHTKLISNKEFRR